jgi:hypothetical protein
MKRFVPKSGGPPDMVIVTGGKSTVVTPHNRRIVNPHDPRRVVVKPVDKVIKK